MGLSKIHVGEVSTADQRLLGSRKLHQWVNKPKTLDANHFDNEAQCFELELVKLITIARLHTEVSAKSMQAPTQEDIPHIPR